MKTQMDIFEKVAFGIGRIICAVSSLEFFMPGRDVICRQRYRLNSYLFLRSLRPALRTLLHQRNTDDTTRPHAPRVFTLSVLTLSLTATLVSACHNQTEKTSAVAPPSVHVTTAKNVSWPRIVKVPGTVSTVDKAILASRTGGWVTKVQVNAGSHVLPGTLLAEVGISDARGRLAEAQAQLTAAEANFKEAASNRRRYQALYRAHTASAAQNEAAQRRFVTAQAEVAAATTALAVAKSNLDYAQIRAPFAGTVAQKNVWPGDFAAPNATLFVIAGDTPEIRAHVGFDTYSALKRGNAARVIVDGKELPATLTRIVAAADPETRTHLVELRLKDKVPAPFGAYAELRLTVGHFPQLTVPDRALTRRAGLLGVLVVDKNHRVHFRLVRIGRSRQGRVAIAAGLVAGEMVAVAPPADIPNDALIHPVTTAPRSSIPGHRGG